MKKIFYVPGLISALLIPVLFWYYINPYIDYTVYSVIDIGLPAKFSKDNYNQNTTFEPLRNWSYKKIIVPPNEAKNNSDFLFPKSKQCRKEMRKIPGLSLFFPKKILMQISFPF
jgi:hypothetical protein